MPAYNIKRINITVLYLPDIRYNIMYNKINVWARQSRHRAKKHGVENNLQTADLHELLRAYNGLCAYCGNTATTMDHPFPIGNKAPNVLANVLPCCDKCKAKKGNSDLIMFYENNNIAREHLVALLRGMLDRDGSYLLRDHIKGVTGIGL